MTNKSSKNGKAFEYACITALQEIILPLRPVKIIQNNSFIVAEENWQSMDTEEKNNYGIAAKKGVETIVSMEPKICEKSLEPLELIIQSDDHGKIGDVRDVLIIRKSIEWEIGISIKHNHEAVKHSRLSTKLDFANKWFGLNCSERYFEEIKPIFENLSELKLKKTYWRDIENKAEKIYMPILTAFMSEIKRQYDLNGELVPSKMTQYLIGTHDYYKLISNPKKYQTRLMLFNLYGTLNQVITSSSLKTRIKLPTRIINIEMKPDSDNTIELYMNNGWAISFRIHNAASLVEPSLKFDVQLMGIPAGIYTIDVPWNEENS